MAESKRKSHTPDPGLERIEPQALQAVSQRLRPNGGCTIRRGQIRVTASAEQVREALRTERP